MITYYNNTMISEAGLKAPNPSWHLADFEQITRKLNADKNGDNKIDRYGFAMANLHREHWFYRHGVPLFNADDTDAIPDVNKAAELFAYMQNLVQLGSLAPVQVGDRVTFYKGNTVAIIDEGPWALSVIHDNASFDFGIVPIPQGNEKATLLFLDGNAIPVGAPHPEAAWKFLKFLSSPEIAPMWVKTKGAPSTVRSAASAYYKMYGDIPGVEAVLDAITYGRTLPTAISYDLVRSKLNTVLINVLAMKISPIQAAMDLKTSFNTELAAWKKKY